jgi:hypothetical protein
VGEGRIAVSLNVESPDTYHLADTMLHLMNFGTSQRAHKSPASPHFHHAELVAQEVTGPSAVELGLARAFLGCVAH